MKKDQINILKDRGIISVLGKDSKEFLQNIITNDINIVNKDNGKADNAYSKVLASLSGKWTYEELNKFLYKPKLYSKGTKMNYAGLSKTKDRANLIAWLRTKSDSPVSLP